MLIALDFNLSIVADNSRAKRIRDNRDPAKTAIAGESLVLHFYFRDRGVKLGFSNGLDAFHNLNKPSPGFLAFVPQKECLFPLFKHRIPRFYSAIANEINFARLRNLIEQDVRANPSGASCRLR
jgi:hypothetical protein